MALCKQNLLKVCNSAYIFCSSGWANICLDCRGISLTRVINPEAKFPSCCASSILLQRARLRAGGSFDRLNHNETGNGTDLTSPDRDPRHQYQCLVQKQRENSTGFLLTPAPLANAGVQKALLPTLFVCLFNTCTLLFTY